MHTLCLEVNKSYHVLAKEVKPLQRSHSLRTRLNISKCDMGLSSHLTILDSDDIKDRAIGREKGVERKAEIRFCEFLGQIFQVETVKL